MQPHTDPPYPWVAIYRIVFMIVAIAGLILQAHTRMDTERTERTVSVVATVVPTLVPLPVNGTPTPRS